MTQKSTSQHPSQSGNGQADDAGRGADRPMGRGTQEPPPGAGDAWEPPADPAADIEPEALVTGTAPPEQGPDPFDPASLRIESDFAKTAGLKKEILHLPHRKPDKSWWVRADPRKEYRLTTTVIELKGERGGGESYIVAPHLRTALVTEPTFRPRLYVAAVTTEGDTFLWEVNLPRDDREDAWSKTVLAAVEKATRQWVRVYANMKAGCYNAVTATGQLPEPQWPDMSFREMLRLSFKDHYIDSLDHPVLRRLRGEVG